MDILTTSAIYVIPFVLVLSIVVFIHEYGHFIVGRWCGIQVDAFSIGFGPELWAHIDRHGTRWRVAMVPLGGYVKFHGDANGASVVDPEALANMPAEERAVKVKDFVKRMRYKGPVFEISALTHEGCEQLVRDVFQHIQVQHTAEHPPAETDPRFIVPAPTALKDAKSEGV